MAKAPKAPTPATPAPAAAAATAGGVNITSDVSNAFALQAKLSANLRAWVLLSGVENPSEDIKTILTKLHERLDRGINAATTIKEANQLGTYYNTHSFAYPQADDATKGRMQAAYATWLTMVADKISDIIDSTQPNLEDVDANLGEVALERIERGLRAKIQAASKPATPEAKDAKPAADKTPAATNEKLGALARTKALWASLKNVKISFGKKKPDADKKAKPASGSLGLVVDATVAKAIAEQIRAKQAAVAAKQTEVTPPEEAPTQ